MGLHINKQADLDAMLNKFAKFNPKNNSNSNQVESEKEIEDKLSNFIKETEGKKYTLNICSILCGGEPKDYEKKNVE